MKVIALLTVMALGLSVQHAPSLSEIDRLTLENIGLQAQLAEALRLNAVCQAELGPLRAQAHKGSIDAQIEKLRAAIEGKFPGYTLNVATGALVKKDQ